MLSENKFGMCWIKNLNGDQIEAALVILNGEVAKTVVSFWCHFDLFPSFRDCPTDDKERFHWNTTHLQQFGPTGSKSCASQSCNWERQN